MTIIQPISEIELARRRRQLRQKKQLKLLQTLWQTLAVGVIAYGGGWLIAQPNWVIRAPEQVIITGNQLVTTEALRQILPIDYPQSLFRLKPHEIAFTLQSKGPVAEAVVSRQLFPLRLIIAVTERFPVAIAIPSPPKSAPVGLIDDQGIWMPLENYTSLTSFPLPSLKIIGQLDQYQAKWPQLYPLLQRSPVPISEINWENPKNLILTTELGKVHLGPYTPHLSQQLQVLDQMRQLPQQLDPRQMEYIDLKNPDAPSIQMKSSAPKVLPPQ